RYRRMVRIRRFEERVSVLYRDGEVPGFVHVSLLQAGSAVGACWPLRPSDVITSTHRGHGHCLAKGLEAEPMFAELMGRDAGTCRGRGGSMHIADPRQGVFGANGIVGAGLPIATGAAFAAKARGEGDVVVAFFGDGAVSQGLFHESVNLAALWDLPVVFFCENNGYAEFSALPDYAPAPLEGRGAAYGVDHVPVDGNDVEAVAAAMAGVVDQLRADAGPVLVEARTYRWHGHYEGDPERYRSAEEVGAWKERDPLAIARAGLRGRGLDGGTLDAIAGDIAGEIERAVAGARSLPAPTPSSLPCFVTSARPRVDEQAVDPGAEIFRTMDAIRLALEHEMEGDPSVFVAGIDVGKGGNVFGVTRGLHDRWPHRVLDTPIS